MKQYLASVITPVTLLLFLLLLFAFNFSACTRTKKSIHKPEFEGTIIYAVSASSGPSGVYTTEQLRSMFGDTAIYYFKHGKYLMSFNGEDLKAMYYFSAENKEYTWRKNIDTLFYADCSHEPYKLLNVEEFGANDTICGLPCKKMVITTDKNTKTYYYPSELYSDPTNFQKHISGNINIYSSKAQAPFLMYVYEGKHFSYSYKAIAIKEQKLSDNLFALPQLPLKDWDLY